MPAKKTTKKKASKKPTAAEAREHAERALEAAEERRRPPLTLNPFDGMELVDLELPIERRSGVFSARRISVQQLTREQCRAYRMLFDGLEGRAELNNGRRVTNQGDAIRWILERIAEQVVEA